MYLSLLYYYLITFVLIPTVGYVHYFCAGAGILSEAAGFANNGPFDVHFHQGVKHTIEVRFC